MKCRDCTCAIRGYFKSVPEAYVCIGVKNPFVINCFPDAECAVYGNKKNDGVFSDKDDKKFCEWKRTCHDLMLKSPHKNSACFGKDIAGRFIYCPYCGKKLLMVGRC